MRYGQHFMYFLLSMPIALLLSTPLPDLVIPDLDSPELIKQLDQQVQREADKVTAEYAQMSDTEIMRAVVYEPEFNKESSNEK